MMALAANGFQTFWRRFKGRIVGIGMTVLALLQAGCHTPPLAAAPQEPVAPAPKTSANVFRASARLPVHIRRVGVLPLAADLDDPEGKAGQAALEPVLRAELTKCRIFELVFISPEQLKDRTGQEQWTAEESLPPDFFQHLTADFGCDAILFSRLTHFRAYSPLLIGWNLKLVESEEPRIQWSVDEVFDAGHQSVAAAARNYSKASFHDSRPPADGQTILLSPQRFGQYSLDAVLATLPTR
jgi:hypothetical protein